MRMAGPDIVLFVVGALLFGGATYAIVATDDLGGSTSALGVFQVTYGTRAVEIGSQTAASMRSASAEFDVAEPGVTRILVTVACTDAIPVPFQLQVSVAGPNGQTGEGSGNCGAPVEIPIEIGPLPADTSVAGSTEAEARANLPALENNTAVGAWTITVSGSRGQTPVPVPVADPSGTITLSAEVPDARLAPVQR